MPPALVAADLDFAPAAQAPAAQAPAPTIEERLVARARDNLHPLQFNGRTFSGPGWNLIVREGLASDFLLLGEEHGTVQVPHLTRELFSALRPAGYDKLVIELSAPIADDLDRAASKGLDGIRSYYRSYPPGPAFHSCKDEAELLAAVRAMVPPSQRAIWGIDYEVLGDRQMIRHLKERAPARSLSAIGRLAEASERGWSGMRERGDIQGLLMFSGDPKLVQAVRATWQSPDPHSSIILDTLQQTLEINTLVRTSNWSSMSGERPSRARISSACCRQNEKVGAGPKLLSSFEDPVALLLCFSAKPRLLGLAPLDPPRLPTSPIDVDNG